VRRRERTHELRRQGLSLARIAQQLGVSHTTVVHDLGDEPPPERVVGLDGSVHGLRGRAVELYGQGQTVAEIAEVLGLSRSTVARAIADDEWWLDSSGEDVHWRPTGWPPQEVRHLLQEARRRGEDFHDAWEIALTGVFWPGRFLTRTERDEWAEALEWSRPYFRAAYYGEGTDPLGALRLVAV
jgi:DNA-binding CsgD family transcriptional regulator